MARFTLKTAFSGVSGKLSGDEDMYFGTNKRTGRSYSASLKNPYTGPRTQKQQTVTTAFTKRTKDVTTWFNANKPLYDAETGALTREATAAYTAVLTAYKSQHKYGNIRAFVSHYMQSDGTLSLTSLTTDNPSDTPSDTSDTPSGDTPSGDTNPDTTNPDVTNPDDDGGITV